MPENQHLEYKQALSDSLEKEVVAFLNHQDGGQIHIGIDDSGAVIGCSTTLAKVNMSSISTIRITT